MKIYKLATKKNVLWVWLIIGLIICTLLIFPTQCRNGAANGIFLCIQVLIPSLLPFMILSSFLVSSNILCYTPKVIGRLCNILFGLPDVCMGVIFLSLIGGYPVGALGINALYKNGYISLNQAKRMIYFCISAGPGFLVTYIGAAMTRDLKTGYILFVSQIISVVLLGIVSRFTIKKKENDKTEPQQKPQLRIKEALVNSVSAGINSSLKISALVILFGSAAEVFLTLTKNKPELEPLVALLEITNGIKITAGKHPIPLISFLCGFGGLCVHFQIFSQLGGVNFSKGLFFIFRSAQAVLCFGATKLLLHYFPVAQEVISTTNNVRPEIDSGIIGIVFLFITCLGFIISVRSLNLSKKSNTLNT